MCPWKRHLGNWVAMGDVSNSALLSAGLSPLKSGVFHALTPGLNLALCLQKWLMFNFPLMLSGGDLRTNSEL